MKQYIMMPISYVQKLKEKGKRQKARAFMEYFLDMHQEDVNSIRFYQKSWGLGSSSTALLWIKEFKEEIEKFYAYWSLKNAQHYNSVSNSIEQKSNTKENQIEQQNIKKSTINRDNNNSNKNTKENQIEQQSNKDSNNINNNINADFSKSANKSSCKKTEYSQVFLKAWNEYDKRNQDGKRVGNKQRSYSVFKRKKFNLVDIKLIIEAIREYKNSLDEWRCMKDFDGFLNGMIDLYLPQRAWVITKTGQKVLGHYYESKDLFRFDSGGDRQISKEKMNELLDGKKIGFVA